MLAKSMGDCFFLSTIQGILGKFLFKIVQWFQRRNVSSDDGHFEFLIA